MSPLEPFQVVGAGPPAGHFALLALGGWAVALAALCGAGVLWRGQDRRLALVAEAAHELRGPLCAARLGLHALESAGEPVAGRAAAVELELRRAGLALEDLQAAPRGRRTGERLEVLDAGALVTARGDGLVDDRALARRPAADRARGRPGARPRATAFGWPRRWATSSPTRPSTAAERCSCALGRGARGCGSRSPTTARACPPRCQSSPPPAATRTAPAVTGWRSRGGSPSATAAVFSPRPRVRGARLVLDLPLARPAPQARPPAVWLGRRRRVAAADHATPLATGPAAPPAATRAAVPPDTGSPRHR